MKAAILAFARTRLRQASTWVGIVGAVAGLCGIGIDDATAQTLGAAAAIVVGGLAVWLDA